MSDVLKSYNVVSIFWYRIQIIYVIIILSYCTQSNAIAYQTVEYIPTEFLIPLIAFGRNENDIRVFVAKSGESKYN